jgi:hypothetical protein
MVLLIVLVAAGCMYDSPVGSTTASSPLSESEGNDTLQNITSATASVERFVPENILRIGERFRYNDVTGIHEPSGAGDTISIWIDGTTVSKGYYLKARYLGAELINCPADEGEKYLFVRIKSVALRNSAYTPYIDSFSLVADDGRMYSPSLCFCDDALCLAGGEAGFYGNVEVANLYTIQDIGGIYTSSLIDRSEVQAMIMFTVPDSFSKSSSYLVLDTGGAEAVWSLSDVYVDATVRKGTGRIYLSVQNAGNLQLVRDMTLSLGYPDGTISETEGEIPKIGETISIEVPDSGYENITIAANLYNGEKMVIYTEKQAL